MTGATFPDAQRHAETADEAIRAINRATLGGDQPAPLAYSLIGALKSASNRLPQAFDQIAAGLTRSLDSFELKEDDGRNPALSIMDANEHLARASALADQLGDELERAQSAIAKQGYKRVSD